MAIKNVREMRAEPIVIDLAGPQGNAFYLLGLARKLAEQLDRDADAISVEMKAGNYDHLLEVFEREFGDFVTLYPDMGDDEDDDETCICGNLLDDEGLCPDCDGEEEDED